MKYFNWDKKKNLKLKETRGISFEEIVFYISNGAVIDVIENQNSEKYKDQLMFIIEIDSYAYIVPFVENNDEIFLKTIYPSRKATKDYLNREE
jgi:uncharacterized DUF497 family protein